MKWCRGVLVRSVWLWIAVLNIGIAQQWLIHRIEFVGNEFFRDEFLQSVIHLKPTAYTLVDRFLLGFTHLTLHVPEAPEWLRRFSKQLQRQIEQTRQVFYNPTVAEQDRQLLLRLYNAYGFHEADVTVHFYRDTVHHSNVVRFEIWEGRRAVLDTVVVLGTAALPPPLRFAVDTVFQRLSGKPVSMLRIEQGIQRALGILRDEGFLKATAHAPVLSYNTANVADSVTITVLPGKRYRIAAIEIQLETRGQKPVSRKLIREQILLQAGQWCRRRLILETERRLRRLSNVFEYVAIDTVQKPEWEQDSLLGLRIRLRMRKTESVEASLFYAKYPFTISWDFGGIAEYQHRNIFGAAQQFRWYLKGALRDPVGVFTGAVAPFYEIQTGVSLQQPYLLKLAGYPVAARGEFVAAQQFVTRLLQLQLLQVGITFPVNFGRPHFVHTALLGLQMQRVKPLNFAQAYAQALHYATTAEDTLRIQRQLFLYAVLDTVMNVEKSFFTTSLLEFQVSGDTRNHPFFPSRGHFVSLSAEAAGILPGVLRGNSRYIRVQLYGTFFLPLSSRWVFAFKQRVGHIFWIDKRSYVPLDKHFFAGGSNSLRAWVTRRLSAYIPERGTAVANLTDIVGGGSLVEGSAEFRFRFPYTGQPATVLEAILNKVLGWTLFVDWGNMFNSFLAGPEQYNREKFLRNIALDAGIGIRLGVDTAPPVRIDLAFPVYDPAAQRWFFQRLSSLPFRWQIAIGEAF